MGDADRQHVDHAVGRVPADQRAPVHPRHVHGHGGDDPHRNADLPAHRHEVRHGPGAVRHGDADQLRARPEHAAGGHGAVRRLRHRRHLGRRGDEDDLAVLRRADRQRCCSSPTCRRSRSRCRGCSWATPTEAAASRHHCGIDRQWPIDSMSPSAASSTRRTPSASRRSGRLPSRRSTGSTSSRPPCYRWHPASGERRAWPLPAAVGSIGLRESGGLVAALRSGFHLFDLDTGELTFLGASRARPADQPPQRRQGVARRRLLGRHDGRPARKGSRRRALPARRRPPRAAHGRTASRSPTAWPGAPTAACSTTPTRAAATIWQRTHDMASGAHRRPRRPSSPCSPNGAGPTAARPTSKAATGAAASGRAASTASARRAN